MTKAEKEHYKKVADVGCILCLYKGFVDTPCEIHHIRKGGMRRKDAPVIGLCPEHHRGASGVHGLGRKAFIEFHKVDEDFLLMLLQGILDLHEIHKITRNKSWVNK